MDTIPVPAVSPLPVVGRGVVLGSDPSQLADDLALAASLGVQIVRLDLPWARAQPRAGSIDQDVIESVISTAMLARRHGLEPWFRLLQARVPTWFDNEGGFTDARFAGRFWPRWVEAAADALGDLAAGWVPFEAPFALAARLVPDNPAVHGELVDTLVVAWRDAWRILHGGTPVATSLDVAVVRPSDDSPPAVEAARRFDQLRWGVWLGGLANGTISIPGRADRELTDLAGACDIVGLAIRADTETVLYRAAEMAPDRPLALTFRPQGASDAERTKSIESMWRSARRAAEELRLVSVSITPFADERDPSGAANDGIVTRDREPKDSAHAFLTG